MKPNSMAQLNSWVKTFFLVFGLAFIVRTFLFSPYIVEGASMEPTLHNHEKILVNKLNMANHFNRGEIVILQGDNKYFVKRIIGLPGETISMKNDKLFINGVLVKEPYLSHNLKLAKQMGTKLTEDFGPITVPKDKYFVMGDNRLYSMDSRNGLGYFTKEQIIGQSEFVFFPFSHIRSIK